MELEIGQSLDYQDCKNIARSENYKTNIYQKRRKHSWKSVFFIFWIYWWKSVYHRMISSPYTVRQSRGGESTRPKAFKPIRWGHSEQEIGHQYHQHHCFFLQYHINITIIIITIIFKMICDAPVVQVCTGIDVFCASRLNAAVTVPLLHSVNLCSNFHNCCRLSYFLKHFCTHHAWTQRVQCHRTIIIHTVNFSSNKASIGLLGQDTIQAGTFWGVHNVSLCASCVQLGAGISKNVTDIHFFVLKGVPTDLLDV